MERFADFLERHVRALAAIGLVLWVVFVLTLIAGFIAVTVRLIQGVC